MLVCDMIEKGIAVVPREPIIMLSTLVIRNSIIKI